MVASSVLQARITGGHEYQASGYYTRFYSSVKQLCFFLLVQPGLSSHLGPAAEGAIETGHIEGLGVAHKHLAGKIWAHATVFQAPRYDAAGKERALTSWRRAQLVAAAAAIAGAVDLTRAAVAATEGGQFSALKIFTSHSHFLVWTDVTGCRARFRVGCIPYWANSREDCRAFASLPGP
jgi:hypothetical protein